MHASSAAPQIGIPQSGKAYSIPEARNKPLPEAVHEISMEDMIRRLETQDHTRIRATLDRIDKLFSHAGDNAAGTPFILTQIEPHLAAAKSVLEDVMVVEEKVIFKLICSLEREEKLRTCQQANIAGPIRAIRRNQTRNEEELCTIMQLADWLRLENGECGVCVAIHKEIRDLKADIEEHFRIERERLFPRALNHEAGLSAGGHKS